MSQSMEFWSAHLSAIDAAGITAKAYAQQQGLSVSSLYYWRRQLRQTAGREVVASAAAFVPVQVVAAGSGNSASCSLVLAPGVRLELAQLPAPEWLAALGRALQGVR